jgi:hypothetical protein
MEESSGIDLNFDSKYRDLRDKIAEKYFGGVKGSARDACLFALSLGIRFNRRAPKKSWTKEKPLSWSDTNRLKSEIADFEVLFDYMDIDDGGMNTKSRMDEFVTGGLRFIEENDLVEDGSLVEIALD